MEPELGCWSYSIIEVKSYSSSFSSNYYFIDASNIRSVIEEYVKNGDRAKERDVTRNIVRKKKVKPKEESGERPREGRQSSDEDECENQGYETQIQESCETVADTECFNVTVTKTRKDIKKTCRTRVSEIRRGIEL